MIAKVPLILDPQPEGGYTVTSPLLRGLVTEGDTIAEALFNAQDAFQAMVEIHEYLNDPLPPELFIEHSDGEPLQIEILAPVEIPAWGTRLPTPVNVRPLDDLKIWLEYEDGVKGVIDLSDMKDKGVFKAWNDRSFFERVHIDGKGSVSWGFDSNGVEFDLATDVLYANVLGISREDMKSMDGFEDLHSEIEKRREIHHAGNQSLEI